MGSIASKKRALRKCKRCDNSFDVSKSKCPACGYWDAPNHMIETEDETTLLSDVSERPLSRISGTGPWDRVFSYNPSTGESGLVTVQTILIGGIPGAGKSTLALQTADRIAAMAKRETLYIAAEEAKEQIKDRALRLKLPNLNLIRVYPLGASTDLGEIFQRRKPAAVVVDSLPGLTGELAQAVEYCKAFKEYAVVLNCPFIIIDHATKDEALAGLMALQHEVDTTALFTVLDDKVKTRRLENLKNRFGPLQVCYLDMTETGLVGKTYDESDDGETDRDWTDDGNE